MLGKNPAALTNQISRTLHVPNSAYGQCVPYCFGRSRSGHKLVFWNNFKSIQNSGKKGSKGGTNVTYTVDVDLLLGYGDFECVLSTWINQSWFAANYQFQTFVGVGTGTSFTFTVTANTRTFIAVMGVMAQVPYSFSFADYAGPGVTVSSSGSGNTLLPLFNAQFAAPNYGTYANSTLPYATYNSTPGSTSVTVHFPSAVTAPTVVVYYAQNGDVDNPPTSTGGKKGGGGTPLTAQNLVFERHLGSGPEGYPYGLTEFSGVGSAGMPLGPSPEIPFINYEWKALFGMGIPVSISTYNSSTNSYLVQTTMGDCCPADVIIDIITSGDRTANSTEIWHHGLGFTAFNGSTSNVVYSYSRFGSILKDESTLFSGSNLGLNALRNYCMAYGIVISGVKDSQSTAAEFLTELCEIANSAPVWDGTGLDFIPYCEVSSFSFGYTYTAPTASGPIFNLTKDHFVQTKGTPNIVETRDRPQGNFNSLQIGFRDPTQQYNSNYVIVADSMDIMIQGPLPGGQKTYDYIHNGVIAQSVGWALLHRKLNAERCTYSFELPAYWECILTPMDLVTVFDSTINSQPIPVRIKTIEISADSSGKRKMAVTAEPFFYGGSLPLPPYVTGTPVPNGSGVQGSNPSGTVNTPIFIETIPAMYPAAPQLWMCLSSSTPTYGGCTIWLSLDGGTTYAPIGTITGSQTMGAVYSSNYPSHADPDNADTLNVDLTQSLGTLLSQSAATQNAFGSLCYLAGGGTVVVNGQTLTIPYELVAYGTATLSSANKYALAPPIRRGVYNTPIAAHNIGSPFSFLVDGLVFRMNLQASMIGLTLNFKFTAFNNTGGNQQSLADVSAFTFTPTGLVGWTYNVGGTGGTGQTGNSGGANDLYMYAPGPYGTASAELWSAQPTRNVTLPAGLTHSLASCDVAPTGSVTMQINKISGGVTTGIGTVNFAAGATSGTFTFASQVTLNGTGDIIEVLAPGTVDATFAGARVTFWATRSN